MAVEKFPPLPEALQPYAQGHLEQGVVLELSGPNGLIKRTRFRLATPLDLDGLYQLEQATWPKELALPREEIEEGIRDFSGLQILAIDQDSKKPLGWASVTRAPIEVILGDANCWEERIHAHISSNGNAFEGLGIAVPESEKGYHIGRAMIIFASRAVARKLVEENRVDDPFAYRLTGRAAGYGDWLREKKLEPNLTNFAAYLEPNLTNFAAYVDGVKNGQWKDPVLSTNFGVVDLSDGLVEQVGLVPNSWPKDNAAKGAGVRFDRTNLVRAFIPTEQQRATKAA